MRNHFDNINGGIAISYLGAILAGWTIDKWAAFFALVYSLMLIIGKLWQFGRWLRTRGA
jgi:hypothetical protein